MVSNGANYFLRFALRRVLFVAVNHKNEIYQYEVG